MDRVGRFASSGLWLSKHLLYYSPYCGIGEVPVDFRMGEGASALRGELRRLVHEHGAADFLGALTDDPADLETAQRFCRRLAERGLLCLAGAAERGGRGASARERAGARAAG